MSHKLVIHAATEPAHRSKFGNQEESASVDELDSAIVRHLQRDARQTNRDLARTLGMAPDTVKWHLKNIYGKLGVAGRDEAVAWVRLSGSGPG